MKINPNYKIHDIAGETIVVNHGTPQANMTCIISLNASARLLYQTLAEQYFTVEDATKVLVDTYGIDNERAWKDAEKWVESLMPCRVNR